MIGASLEGMVDSFQIAMTNILFGVRIDIRGGAHPLLPTSRIVAPIAPEFARCALNCGVGRLSPPPPVAGHRRSWGQRRRKPRARRRLPRPVLGGISTDSSLPPSAVRRWPGDA